MRTRKFGSGMVLAAAACLLAGTGGAGEKGKVWEKFLPPEAYKELVARAAKNAEEALAGNPSEEAIKKAQFNALMIAGYTMSVQDKAGQALGPTREFALQLVKSAGEKDKLAFARKYAKALAAWDLKDTGEAGKPLANPQAYLAARADLMEHFKTKAKGGEGIHPALQSNIRLKGTQNGIEEKLRSLSMKKLTEAGAKKEAGELALLGYRAAVLGELTYSYAPKKNAKEWHDLSLQMRDAGVSLAEAAKKKDAEAVLKASNSLNSSCNQCHSAFRK